MSTASETIISGGGGGTGAKLNRNRPLVMYDLYGHLFSKCPRRLHLVHNSLLPQILICPTYPPSVLHISPHFLHVRISTLIFIIRLGFKINFSMYLHGKKTERRLLNYIFLFFADCN